MDRRKFLHNLGIGAAACAVVPLIETRGEQVSRVTINDTAVANMTPKEILDFYENHGILLIDKKHQHYR